jgi:hypothetical protein
MNPIVFLRLGSETDLMSGRALRVMALILCCFASSARVGDTALAPEARNPICATAARILSASASACATVLSEKVYKNPGDGIRNLSLRKVFAGFTDRPVN